MEKLFIQVSFKPDKVGHTASMVIFGLFIYCSLVGVKDWKSLRLGRDEKCIFFAAFLNEAIYIGT